MMRAGQGVCALPMRVRSLVREEPLRNIWPACVEPDPKYPLLSRALRLGRVSRPLSPVSVDSIAWPSVSHSVPGITEATAIFDGDGGVYLTVRAAPCLHQCLAHHRGSETRCPD